MPTGNSMFDEGGLQQAGAVQNTGVEGGRARMQALIQEASLMDGYWKGTASNGFQQGLANLHAHGNSLFDHLNTMAELTGKTNNQFVATHDATTAQANAMAQAQGENFVTGLPGL